MEKPPKIALNIQGTVLNGQNSQLLTSTGIKSVDEILGGGLPIGTVTIIEEDIYGSYAKILLDHFFAEGVINKHSTVVASLNINPCNIIKNLPSVIFHDSEPIQQAKSLEKMKIAFRYENLPNRNEEPIIDHYFDLTTKMPLSDIENSDINYWNGQRIEKEKSPFSNPAYNSLLKSIKEKIKDSQLFLKDNPLKKTILRIGIHSLGSPLWLPSQNSFHLLNESRDLDMFIFCLRALVRSAYAVAVITIPSYLYHENSLDRCIHSSDIAIRLQSFCGTKLEKNFSLANYHGFFHVTKLAAINSFVSKHPGSVEYVFKLKQKKFLVEKLHLPPDLQDSSSNEDAKLSTACGVNNKLDF